ncbi:MAG TPA: aspartate dehydrogenase domain-containing protein [Stellaceae bacterium]|jgi:aspartate dehydrogenase|nr:aspartate dehydrogenase domain-containing protein [Stellaceae bacterium]
MSGFSPALPVRIGLAGFGNVGQELARRLTAGVVPEARLAAATARDLDRARGNAAKFAPAPEIVPLAELPALADIVVECATAESFPEIAQTVLTAGKYLIAVSAGGVPNCPEMMELARAHGGRVRIASGAMPGLDIIRCAAEGGISSVHLRSRIKPDSMAHERYVLDRGHDFGARPPTAPVKVFEGSAGEAAAAFPRHFNVAVSLSLAGIGFDRTTVEVWADPGIRGAIHHVEVEGEDIALTLESRNRPSQNPRTSRIVAPSIIAAIRALVAPVTVGS